MHLWPIIRWLPANSSRAEFAALLQQDLLGASSRIFLTEFGGNLNVRTHARTARTHACTDEQMNKYSYLAIVKRYCYQHSCRPCSRALALAFSLSRTHPPAVPCIHVDTAVDDSNDNGNHLYLYSHSCTESYCTDSYTQAANLNYEQPVQDNNDVNCLQGMDDGVTALRARGEGIKGAYHWYTLVLPFLHNGAPHQYLFEVAPSIATCCKFTC